MEISDTRNGFTSRFPELVARCRVSPPGPGDNEPVRLRLDIGPTSRQAGPAVVARVVVYHEFY